MTNIPMQQILCTVINSFALCATQHFAHAQNTVSPLKPGMAWHIESLPIKSAVLLETEGNARPQGTPASARTVTSGEKIEENVVGINFRKVTRRLARNYTRTRYFFRGLNNLQMEYDGSFQVLQDDPDDSFRPASPQRLNELDWVRQRWLVGERVLDGVLCEIYKAPLRFTGSTELPDDSYTPPDGEVMIFSAIGKEDRFPRRVETPYQVLRYVRLPDVNPPPQLPPEAVLVIEDFKEKSLRLSRLYNIPQ